MYAGIKLKKISVFLKKGIKFRRKEAIYIYEKQELDNQNRL